MRILICSLVIFFSCSTPYKFTQRELPLQENRAAQVVVPKGYSKVERLDTVGRTDEIYHYGGGTIFYFSTITSGSHEWIDTTRHVPKVHTNGAILYKGMTEGPIWWRETRIKNLRVGYKNVPTSLELQFDSAANYFRDHSILRVP